MALNDSDISGGNLLLITDPTKAAGYSIGRNVAPSAVPNSENLPSADTVTTLNSGTNSIGTVILGPGTANIGTVAVTGTLGGGGGGVISAGTNSIGTVGLNAGTNTVGSVILAPGTSNIGTVALSGTFALSGALAAGTNDIGSVGLVAGTANIGTVALSGLPVLPAGTNSIGSVVNATGTNSIGAVTLNAGTNSIGSVVNATGTNSIGSIVFTGSTGTDFSVNAAAIPISGFSLLATVAVNASRNNIEIQNQSTGNVQVVKDDGTGANQTSFILNAASAVGSGGGYWNSQTFKGRVRVYALTGAEIAISQD